MKGVRTRPAYQIVEALKRRRVRQADVARLAGVSQSTVNYVIRRRPVRASTRDRVWTVLEELLLQKEVATP